MKARKGRAPIGQGADQPACSDMLTHPVLRHEGQAITGKRGADAIATAEQKIAALQQQIDAYRELSSSLAIDD